MPTQNPASLTEPTPAIETQADFFEPESNVAWSFYHQSARGGGNDESAPKSQEEPAWKTAWKRRLMPIARDFPVYAESEFDVFLQAAQQAAQAGDMDTFAELLSRPVAQHMQDGGKRQADGFEFALLVVETDPTPDESMVKTLLRWNPRLPFMGRRPAADEKLDEQIGWEETEPLAQKIMRTFPAGALPMWAQNEGWSAQNYSSMNVVHEAMSGGEEEALEILLKNGGTTLCKDADGLTALEYGVRSPTETRVLAIACDEVGDFSDISRKRLAVGAFAGAIEKWDAELARSILDRGGRGWVKSHSEEIPDWAESLTQRFMRTRIAQDWTDIDSSRGGPRSRGKAAWQLLLSESLLPGFTPEDLWVKVARSDDESGSAALVALAAQDAGFAPAPESAVFTTALAERLAQLRAVFAGSDFEPHWADLSGQARSAIERQALRAALREHAAAAPAREASGVAEGPPGAKGRPASRL